MLQMRQLDLFDDVPNGLAEIKKEVEEVSESCDKVRKAMFARHNSLQKKYDEIANRLEIIERNLCKGDD